MKLVAIVFLSTLTGLTIACSGSSEPGTPGSNGSSGDGPGRTCGGPSPGEDVDTQRADVPCGGPPEAYDSPPPANQGPTPSPGPGPGKAKTKEGFSCKASSDCETNLCVRGYCTKPCTSGDQCAFVSKCTKYEGQFLCAHWD